MTDNFIWKNGEKAAVSLTFDDARISQIDTGMEIFSRYDAKATFYVSPGALKERTEGWRFAVQAGHEIGNHTYTHPCSGNFDFSKDTALENYTLNQMDGDLQQADDEIEKLLGIKPVTFAYPCGQSYVGRGKDTRSYVPLVAERFLAGRGFLAECDNDPLGCDLSRLNSYSSDSLDADTLITFVDDTVKKGHWLILAGHEIGNPEIRQTTGAGVIEQLITYIMENKQDLQLVHLAVAPSLVKSLKIDL